MDFSAIAKFSLETGLIGSNDINVHESVADNQNTDINKITDQTS
ncbi:hypothetical protein [Fructilactobacillus lindneri]|nr:hypothetical protein [Fructilactobacillus lindneri]